MGELESWASVSAKGAQFKHQSNSSSRTLSETIGKWVLLMDEE